MKIKLTDPNKLDAVIAKLGQTWPFAEECERFISYGLPVLKEKLQKGETIYLETYMELDGNVMKQYLSYWSDKDIPTDEDCLKQKSHI